MGDIHGLDLGMCILFISKHTCTHTRCTNHACAELELPTSSQDFQASLERLATETGESLFCTLHHDFRYSLFNRGGDACQLVF